MIRQLFVGVVGTALLSITATAADYKIEAIQQAPPDDLAADVVKQLAPSGYKVLAGSRTQCEIWLCQKWPAQADFTASQTVLYPFEMGELIGAIRFPRKATDFRGQEISAGTYTLRYGQQPVDGNHVGTSDTLDFLLLIPAGDDTEPARLGKDELFQRSVEASGTTHPAIMTMLAVSTAGDAEPPAMVHDEGRELWSVVLKGTAVAGEKSSDQKVVFVVVGQAAE